MFSLCPTVASATLISSLPSAAAAVFTATSRASFLVGRSLITANALALAFVKSRSRDVSARALKLNNSGLVGQSMKSVARIASIAALSVCGGVSTINQVTPRLAALAIISGSFSGSALSTIGAFASRNDFHRKALPCGSMSDDPEKQRKEEDAEQRRQHDIFVADCLETHNGAIMPTAEPWKR
jgi:hypothetical protein